MNNQKMISMLPERLLPWYAVNKRELPWRQDRDPYHVWISEIMLQQTRVEAVKGYYGRFLEKLPAIADLAKADDELLHKLWEGLGYYTRVKNLKKAALKVLEDYGGQFPSEYSQVVALPGIGEYTAGAICSIAFNQKTPAVDGNVLRVVSRLLNDDTPVDMPVFKRSVHDLLGAAYPDNAGDFTQALMELGATICGPNKEPDCVHCPCADICKAHACGTENKLPIKSPKRSRRVEEKTVFILSCDGRYALEKRQESGLLAGLWQFPNKPGKLSVQDIMVEVEKIGLTVKYLQRQVERKHIFTHVEWHMSGMYMEVKKVGGPYTWLTAEQIEKDAALPTAFRLFWEEI